MNIVPSPALHPIPTPPTRFKLNPTMYYNTSIQLMQSYVHQPNGWDGTAAGACSAAEAAGAALLGTGLCLVLCT